MENTIEGLNNACVSEPQKLTNFGSIFRLSLQAILFSTFAIVVLAVDKAIRLGLDIAFKKLIILTFFVIDIYNNWKAVNDAIIL